MISLVRDLSFFTLNSSTPSMITNHLILVISEAYPEKTITFILVMGLVQ